MRDEARVRRLADVFAAKYGENWRPSSEDSLLYEVAPTKVFGFGRGDANGPPPQGGFSQTRWHF